MGGKLTASGSSADFLVGTSFFWVALVPLLWLSVRTAYWHWKYSDEFWNTDPVKRSEAAFYKLVWSMVKIWCWFLALRNPDIFANVLSVFKVQLASLSSKKEVSQSKMHQNAPSLALIFLNRSWSRYLISIIHSYHIFHKKCERS